MAVSEASRAATRTAYGGRCGYCGVSETAVGCELEIDHFHPVVAGGSDDDKNLVYACTACNRFKGDYAPAPGAPETLKLLHPKHDNSEVHILETAQGRLSGLTARGWFHIQRLHLNRIQLVEMRGLRRMEHTLRDELAQAQEAEDRLRRENSVLRTEIARLREAILKLRGA
jgi:FtsZ-binding cell division protein ZapB